ncbi:hypothetical protein [Hymenobacter arizonensis]|uniref:Uncharacterized protein n=1 Tax=Hymenobacter arizonensis TaxID=1227077 RepID=A0A1I5Z1P5_HYMAR|nr:hypothetical protein [Hymenobacter arizonensis]SFQ50340.1 hypothetical protein SAMN04515668_2612 [Hymenobacter arizonensis]
MKSAPFFLLMLAGLPFISAAQNSTSDSMRQRGELTGARPSGDLLAKPGARAQAAPRRADSDPIQQHLLNSDVNLARVSAHQLPDLYERFIATTRDERRKWSYQDWDNAGVVLARLNQRYEQVRTELPLEERLRVRTFQGEFHTLRGARQVKDKVE